MRLLLAVSGLGIRVRRQAIILGFAAAVLLVSAWFFDTETGVVTIAAGMVFGWLARHLAPGARPAVPDAAATATATAADIAARLQALEATTSSLRHDLRGILSPALLTAERLLTNTDPVIRRAGEMMVRTVERASERLAETKNAGAD
jgi:signal transduction histidine kinase